MEDAEAIQRVDMGRSPQTQWLLPISLHNSEMGSNWAHPPRVRRVRKRPHAEKAGCAPLILRIFQSNVSWMLSLVPAIPRMRGLLNKRCAGRTNRAIDAGKSGPGRAKAVWRAHMQRGARS